MKLYHCFDNDLLLARDVGGRWEYHLFYNVTCYFLEKNLRELNSKTETDSFDPLINQTEEDARHYQKLNRQVNHSDYSSSS